MLSGNCRTQVLQVSRIISNFFLITVWFLLLFKLNLDESSSESDSDSEDTKRNTPIEKVFAKSLTFLNIVQLSDNEKSTLLKMAEQVINVHSGSF